MGEYFHVAGYFKPNPEAVEVLFLDLTRSELQRKFIRPYDRGERVLLADGRLATLQDLTRVQIIRTEDPSEEALRALQVSHQKAMDELNSSSSGAFFFSIGYGLSSDDIIHTGDEVTSSFISGPPGHPSRLLTFVSNNWTVTIVGGIIVVVVGLLLGVG